MDAALEEARAALATGDVPIGAVVVDAAGEVVGSGRNLREADGRPDRARRGRGDPGRRGRARRAGGSTAARWS